MFGKIGLYLDLLRKGNEVTDPEKWKSRQIKGTVVGAVIIAALNIAKAYGYDLPISAEDANNIGGTIIVIANLLFTASTSKKAGLLPAKSDVDGQSAVPGPDREEVQQPTVPEVAPPVQPKADTTKRDDFDKSLYIG